MNKVAPLLLLVTAMVVADISGQWPEHSVSKIWTSRIVLIALRTRIRSVCVFSISRRSTSWKELFVVVYAGLLCKIRYSSNSKL